MVVPATVGERRAVLMFATASPVHGNGTAPLALDMGGADLSRLTSGRAPLLAQHCADLSAVLGVVEGAWVEGERAFAVVRFARTQAGDDALALVADGIVANVSMGFAYNLSECERLGGTDARLIRWWQPYEVSLVAIPRDWRAHALARPEGEDALAQWEEGRQAVMAYRAKAGGQGQVEAFAAFAADAVAALAQIAPHAAHAFLLSEAERFAAGKLAAEP